MSLFYGGGNQRDNEDMGTKYPSLNHPQKRSDNTTLRRGQQNKNDGMAGMRKSVMLKNEEGQEPSWCTRLCACTKLEYYKDYFKVTNKDVIRRMLTSLQFWKGGFFEPQEQDYDFYGPFWILTTIVFCLGAVSNILNYQGQDQFDYDFSIVGSAFAFMYIEGFGFPILFTFLLKFLGANCTHIQIICIYGYSMVPTIICLLLCSLNVCILHIILLAYAMGSKAAFLIKNIFQSLQISSKKKVIVMGIIIGEVVLQFFVFKLAFIKCASSTPEDGEKIAHNMANYFTIRHFQV